MFHSATSRLRVAAFAGFLAVALGAMGAHLLEARLAGFPKAAEHWKTAALYHLAHAVVLWACAASPRHRAAWLCFLGGIILFSGSLYVLAAAQIKWLGAVTPFGGLFLLAGWLLLAVRAKEI
jgi:uncharacterized membrane protein YgdD (TMEM256/DUF423 family)